MPAWWHWNHVSWTLTMTGEIDCSTTIQIFFCEVCTVDVSGFCRPQVVPCRPHEPCYMIYVYSKRCNEKVKGLLAKVFIAESTPKPKWIPSSKSLYVIRVLMWRRLISPMRRLQPVPLSKIMTVYLNMLWVRLWMLNNTAIFLANYILFYNLKEWCWIVQGSMMFPYIYIMHLLYGGASSCNPPS